MSAELFLMKLIFINILHYIEIFFYTITLISPNKPNLDFFNISPGTPTNSKDQRQFFQTSFCFLSCFFYDNHGVLRPMKQDNEPQV